MKIDRTSSTVSIAAVASGLAKRPAVTSDGDEPSSAPVPPRRDRVEISATGRELAATLAPASAERVARAQQRIADGTYERPEILEAAARRLLDSGDL
jgi:anti-sigma28 factor (negative regulator of flagellin synthesis)